MYSKKLLAAATATACVSLALAGCGSGGSGGSGGDTTISIGVGAPLTDGVVAMGQGIVRGVDLAVAQANDSQALKDLHIKITTVQGDDKGDPTTGGNVATQFTSNPNIVGVVGHLNSGVTRVAVKIYKQANLVEISPANTAIDLTKSGYTNYFRTCANDAVQGQSDADYAFKTLGAKKAFVVDDSTVYGEGLADEWAKQFQTDGGTLAGREKTTDKDTDFKALVTKINAANPQVIFYGGVYNAGALFAKQLKQAGVSATFMGGDGMYDPEFVKIAGADAAKGALVSNVGAPVDQLPKAAQFKADYAAKYPGQSIGAYDANAYDAANAIINAIESVAKSTSASDLTSDSGKKAIIAAVAKSNFDGVTGHVSFDANGDTTNKVVSIYQVSAAGKFVDAKK